MTTDSTEQDRKSEPKQQAQQKKQANRFVPYAPFRQAAVSLITRVQFKDMQTQFFMMGDVAAAPNIVHPEYVSSFLEALAISWPEHNAKP